MPDPTPIGGTLRGLARAWGIADPDETAQLFVSWEQIVGPEVASKCRPSSLKGGVLKVSTESSAWAWELKYLSAEMVRRVNQSVGKPLVKEIKPWVRPPIRENRRDQPPSGNPGNYGNKDKPRPGNSGEEVEQAADLAGRVGDERLGEALKRAVLAAKRSQSR